MKDLSVTIAWATIKKREQRKVLTGKQFGCLISIVDNYHSLVLELVGLTNHLIAQLDRAGENRY